MMSLAFCLYEGSVVYLMIRVMWCLEKPAVEAES